MTALTDLVCPSSAAVQIVTRTAFPIVTMNAPSNPAHLNLRAAQQQTPMAMASPTIRTRVPRNLAR